MIINNQKQKDLDELIQFIDKDKNERKNKSKETSRIKIKLQRMSRESSSVERSGNENRIRQFNKSFIKLLSDLSRLVQTTSNTDKRDIQRMVNNIKSK